MIREALSEPEILEAEEILLGHSYSVVLYDDDVTPCELVICVLIDVFGLTAEECSKKIYEAETKGSAKVKTGCSFSEATDLIRMSEEYCEKKIGRKSPRFSTEEE